MAAEDVPARRTSSRISSKPGTEVAAPPPPTKHIKRKPADGREPSIKKAKAAEEGEAAAEGKEINSTASSKVLTTGSPLPAITLKDESGNDVDISGLKNSVLFTYPKANTPGCTTQACLFRDEYSKFQAAGFKVFGLSSDNEGPLKNWKEKKGFAYSLLSDPKRQLIGPLTGSKSSTIRSHFVIDASGKLAHSVIKVKPVDSSPDALKFAQSLSTSA